jgi:YYY domain-containing protein
MRSRDMPPLDAWLAGHHINYYYIGYVIFGSFGRLIGTTPAVVFNLALATIFGMTIVGAASLGANVLARWMSERAAMIGGGIAAFLTVFAGNPWAAVKVLQGVSAQWHGWFFSAVGWQATRFIPDSGGQPAISEFPAFSFILADLHPHLLALPFAIAALGLTWALVNLPEGTWRRPAVLGRVIPTGVAIGALYAMNSWDFPTYLVVALAAVFAGLHCHSIAERGKIAGALIVSAVVLWAPFYVAFEAPTQPVSQGLANSVGKVPVVGGVIASLAGYTGERTSWDQYLGVFGFVYVVAIALIVATFWRRRALASDALFLRGALGTAVILVLIALLLPAPVVILAGLPIVAIALLVHRDGRFSLENVALGLFALAFLLTLIPEFFFLNDVFGNRMNTVFKLYYQAWLLMAVGAALALVCLWTWLQPARIARLLVPLAAAVIILGGVLYPVVAAHEWLDWRSPNRAWVGVDGLKSDGAAPISPDERAAMDWLWSHNQPDDVLLAAGGCEWDIYVGRVAAATGVPSVIGWQDHERQWHLGDQALVSQIPGRVNDITALYASRPQDLIDKYGITLIYVGPSELGQNLAAKPQAGQCASGPFPTLQDSSFPGPGWSPVFEQGNVRIYRRIGT